VGPSSSPPNGNTWVGTGHNAVVTDLAGLDWFVYHAIDRRNPFLDEVGQDETASVLLRDAPAGDYTVETRLAIDLGENDVRNSQQAGLVAYLGDDHFLRLSHVAIRNTRRTEFGKEMPFADRTSWGGMAVGTPAPVTWLRPPHRTDSADGEHEFRAASSRDGRHWTWAGSGRCRPAPSPGSG